MDPRVLYAGAALSGRSTSIERLAPRVGGDGRPEWERLAAGCDVRLPSGLRRVHIANLNFGNRYFPSIAAAAASDDRRASANAQLAVAWAGELSGVVFVVDSQLERIDASAYRLEQLAAISVDPVRVPFVFQLNKRDLPSALPVSEIRRRLGIRGSAVVESIAPTGYGVAAALDALFVPTAQHEVEPEARVARASPRALFAEWPARALTMDSAITEEVRVHRANDELVLAGRACVAAIWPKKVLVDCAVRPGRYVVDLVERRIEPDGRRQRVAGRVSLPGAVVTAVEILPASGGSGRLVAIGAPAAVAAATRPAIGDDRWRAMDPDGPMVVRRWWRGDMLTLDVREHHVWLGRDRDAVVVEIGACDYSGAHLLGNPGFAPGGYPPG